jgi:hypothetical protein
MHKFYNTYERTSDFRYSDLSGQLRTTDVEDVVFPQSYFTTKFLSMMRPKQFLI